MGAVDPLGELARLEGVGSAVGSARDAVDAVLRDRGRRQVDPQHSATAMITAARASAQLQLGLDDDDLAGEVDQGAWETATVRLYADLIELAGLIRTAPGQAIARAHALLCCDLVDDDDLGRITGGAGAADRIAALNRSLAGPTEAPVIVVAAIAHAELIGVRPFRAGNAVVARAVEHMILIAGDIDAPAVTLPELAYLQAGADYPAALARYRTGTALGVRDWLLHVAAALTLGAELSPLKPIS